MCLSICMRACVCVCLCRLSSVCFQVCLCLCVYAISSAREKTGRGESKMIWGPIHMKQEGSYINIAPRPRGQAIYEANCSPVSHGGRTVYYAWGLVTCFKAAPKTGRLAQWWRGVGCFYYYGILSCEKYVVGGERIIVLLSRAVVRGYSGCCMKGKIRV